MQNKYIPVSCVLYDELELLAMRNITVTIEFQSGESIATTSGIIRDLYTDEAHVEYLSLSNGLILRLDALVQVNGKPVPGYC
ncbi:MAG: Rho-binding antiterminator [Bacteroidia bacterium]